MKWISIQNKKPKNGQLILVNCGLNIEICLISMGHFRENSRKRYPDRIQINSNLGHYSTYLSIDSVHYWMPISDLELIDKE